LVIVDDKLSDQLRMIIRLDCHEKKEDIMNEVG